MWGRGKAKAAPDAIEKDAARLVARRAGRESLGKQTARALCRHRTSCPRAVHLPHDSSSLCHLANFGASALAEERRATMEARRTHRKAGTLRSGAPVRLVRESGRDGGGMPQPDYGLLNLTFRSLTVVNIRCSVFKAALMRANMYLVPRYFVTLRAVLCIHCAKDGAIWYHLLQDGQVYLCTD
jgi:hypothetical protein